MLQHAGAHPAPRQTDRLSPAAVALSKWMAFLAGIAVFVAVALIPPAADLDSMRRQRDRVLAMEQTDLQRLDNYRAMLAALERHDPDTLRLVLASELQLVPRGRTALVAPGQPEDPRLFELLEPPPPVLPAEVSPTVPSALTKLANDDIGRLLLLILASSAILWGVLPWQSETDPA